MYRTLIWHKHLMVLLRACGHSMYDSTSQATNGEKMQMLTLASAVSGRHCQSEQGFYLTRQSDHVSCLEHTRFNIQNASILSIFSLHNQTTVLVHLLFDLLLRQEHLYIGTFYISLHCHLHWYLLFVHTDFTLHFFI
jgi:hypothetical protein